MHPFLLVGRSASFWSQTLRSAVVSAFLALSLGHRAEAQSTTLAQWPLTTDNTPVVVATGLTAGTPTLKRMVASTTTTVTANSTTYGQAIAPTADGTWTTGVGGLGGTVMRRYYQQFTVTASTGTTVRLDSLVLTAAFYATVSNTKLAVVYSKTGFTTNDSTEVTSGTLNGAALTSASSGNFTNTVGLLQNNAGPTSPTNTYRLAFSGATGVTLAAGQTLRAVFRSVYRW